MALDKMGWERKVQGLARTCGSVVWTKHAKQQMRKRAITMMVALDVLRNSVINKEPEQDILTGHTKCRMERYCAGKPTSVVVAVECERASECLVVTAFTIGD